MIKETWLTVKTQSQRSEFSFMIVQKMTPGQKMGPMFGLSLNGQQQKAVEISRQQNQVTRDSGVLYGTPHPEAAVVLGKPLRPSGCQS